MLFNLSKEEKDRLMREIQHFFEVERGEQIGIIASQNILDFFLEQMGGLIYNKGLDDAKFWFMKRMEDVEVDYDLLYKQQM